MRTFSFPRFFLLGCFAGGLATASLVAQPIRILPMGDSLTAGNTPGYRGYLYRQLIDAGVSVDFVGNTSSTPSAPAGVTLDPDHSGYGGFSVGPGPSAADAWTNGKGNLYANIDAWLAPANPRTAATDMIILTIGVNDVGNTGSRDPDYDVANEFHKRMAGLLDKILSVRPDVAILLTTVLPGGNRDQGTVFDISPFATVNPKLAAVVAARSSHVALYDGRNLQGTGLTWASTDFPSGDIVHPNDAGNQKLATFWSTSIRNFLSTRGLPATNYVDTTRPRLAITTPANNAINVGATRPLLLEFDKNIVLGTGTITLKNLSGGADVLLDVTNPAQVGAIRWELSLTPPSLAPGTRYAVQIPDSAVRDLFGNFYAGIADTTTYTFTTSETVNQLYAENFAGGSPGWTVGNGSMSVQSGRFQPTATGSTFSAYTGQRFTGDLIYRATVYNGSAERAGMLFNTQNATTGYAVVVSNANTVEIHKVAGNWYNFQLNGNTTLVASTPFSTGANRAYAMQVNVNSATNTATISVNGVVAFTEHPLTTYLAGSVGFLASYNSLNAWIDDVSVSRPVTPPAAPVITPAAGSYAAPLDVTLSSTTSGAQIRYTTDGTAPTETTGTVYSGQPFRLGASATVRAISVAAGAPVSGVSSVTYTLAPLLSSWRARHGLAADGSQDFARPAGDGLTNIQKYAFNLAPTAGSLLVPTTAILPATNGTIGLPRVDLSAGGSLVVKFIRLRESLAPGVGYSLWTSDNLVTWQNVDLATATIENVDAIWERVTIVIPAVGTQPRFAQVRVTRTP